MDPGGPLIGIGMFARRSRLSMKALRLYHQMGLLRAADVDPVSGYRRYRESQLLTARLIATLRRLDMPLVQVAEVASAPGPRAAELLASYWEAVERRVASQRELVAVARAGLLGGEGRLGTYEVREREVAGQLVLCEQRHVHLHELSGWLRPALARLTRTAGRFGGAAGPPFAFFHGDVTEEESDGPVEVCIPVDPACEEAADVPMRRIPAGREAFVRLTRAQFEYPQVLSAYDAVEQWIGSRRLTATGSPREVYVADFVSAALADEVCEVAYPVSGGAG